MSEKASLVNSSSYFSISSASSDGATPPPPPYFSPSSPDQDRNADKRWIDLLERQNTELMEQITTLSTQANPVPGRKARPMSFHGGLTQLGKEPEDLKVASNVLIQKQLDSMREELMRARRRCAELSEVEAGKRGLEMRCLGLERVVEELMSAIDLMKTHPMPKPFQNEFMLNSKDNKRFKGLAIEFEKESDTEKRSRLQERFGGLIISARRQLIPYRLRAMILFLFTRLQNHDLIDQLFGVGVIMFGALMWAAFLVVDRGKSLVAGTKGKRSK
jgi:hypothetical protein